MLHVLLCASNLCDVCCIPVVRILCVDVTVCGRMIIPVRTNPPNSRFLECVLVEREMSELILDVPIHPRERYNHRSWIKTSAAWFDPHVDETRSFLYKVLYVV